MLAASTSSTLRWKRTTAWGMACMSPASASERRASCIVSAVLMPVSGMGLRHHVGDGALDHLRVEEDGLRERRMRMHGEADVLRIRAHLEREHGLRDELARVHADDARAQDAARAL